MYYMLHIISTSQTKQSTSNRIKKWRKMYIEIRVVCCENRMECVNKLCGQLMNCSVYLVEIIIISQGLKHTLIS
jgi:hypothetical protein